MTRWLRLLALASVLSIGESCGLRPPAVPHLDVRGAAMQALAAQPDRAFVLVGPASNPVFDPGGLRSVRPA